MNAPNIRAGVLLCFALLASLPFQRAFSASSLTFRVTGNEAAPSRAGRLFVILSPSNSPEPRFTISHAGEDAPISLARDIPQLAPDKTNVLDQTAFTFPISNLCSLPARDYFVQALLAFNPDLRLPNAPGNLYSACRRIHVDPEHGDVIRLELDQQVPPEVLPQDTAQLKFIKLQSELLTKFHHRPMFLRAGVILPRDYDREPSRRYPLWVRIGGYGSRYTAVNRLMKDEKEFRPTWLAADTPRFILLQLDGAGPYGDPYYINSANNGPYGDALVQELIPYVERNFRALGEPRARVLSGVSTGGWVSLALQIFYPDFFNGTWSCCPDPVDFRAYERVNIYSDTNAYSDPRGAERVSERDLKGNVVLTMSREVGMENLLGPGNSYTVSGEQWGAWNAVYSPRGADGLPVPLWDPHSGKIDPTVAQQWKKYDLRLILQENWATLGPKLRGKIHIASGEADQYFLNDAVHLLDEFLARAKPPYAGTIVYGSGKGHGWSNLSLQGMLGDMATATGQ
jgi:S-formylglutathione hydrolase FrmB